MTSIKGVLNKDRIKQNGGYALVIQVIHLRKKRVMYLGYDLHEDNFDPINECVVSSKEHPICRKDLKRINESIVKIKKDLKLKIESLSSIGSTYSSSDILSFYRRDKDDVHLFVYLQRQIDEKQRIGKIGIADAYKSTLHSLQRYLSDRSIEFNSINVAFLRDYENYLISTGVVQNTINYYMRNLRTIYNRAYDDGLVSHEQNPFRKYHLHNVRTVKRALKKEEIRRIAGLDLSTDPALECARDFFIFSFFTRGMSPVDILYLKHSDIINGVIFYQRHKTQQPLQVTITEPLQQLIDKYHSDPVYVLPFIEQFQRNSLREQYKVAYTFINFNLKKIAKLAGISTSLTTYVARHSWASIAKEDGAPASAISEGLGHDSEKTTLIYLSNFDRSVIDSINQRVVSL